MAKKSALSVLLLLTFLSAAGSLEAQQARGGRPVQSLWIFSESNPDKPPLPAGPDEQKIWA